MARGEIILCSTILYKDGQEVERVRGGTRYYLGNGVETEVTDRVVKGVSTEGYVRKSSFLTGRQEPALLLFGDDGPHPVPGAPGFSAEHIID